MAVSINDDYDYEPTHYFVAVEGTFVSEPKPWAEADRDRAESEDRAEDGETVELVQASRGDMDRAGLDYTVTSAT